MMTLTGSLATTIVLFTLAGANASGESPRDWAQAPGAVRQGNQALEVEDIVGAIGHRRKFALHKKRKRHGREPAASTPGELGTEPALKNGKEKETDSGGDGDEKPASVEVDANTKSEKAKGAGHAGDEAAEPDRGKKKARASEEGHSAREASASAKPERDDEEGWPAPEALAVAVGPRVMARSLAYTQDIYGRNQGYSLPSAPMVGLAADFYPAALFTDGVAANLGLTADASYLLPVVSTLPPSGSGSYSARSLSWSLGAKMRLPWGAFATVAYGTQRYELASSGGAAGINLPTTGYTFVRGGAGIRYVATRDVSLMVNAGYLHCLGLGPIGAAPFFPKGTGAAFDTGVGVGYRITPMLEVRGGVDVRRYGLAFHQKATDPDLANAVTDPMKKVAGGATDQYISTWVALAVVMDGHSSHAGGRTHGRGAATPPSDTQIPDEAPADQ